MATITVASSDDTVPRGPLSARFSTPQVWGFVLLAPYVLVFIAFVLYPVVCGLWLARHPASYVHLYDDPTFANIAVRAANTAESTAHVCQDEKVSGVMRSPSL